MKVLVSGASGFVGSALVQSLKQDGHSVSQLVRRRESQAERQIYWNPAQGEVDANALAGFDVVVHLAGENIAGARWTDEVKQRIYESRVYGTKLLARALAETSAPPRVLLNASAVGYYGDTGGSQVDESAAQGEGFLADVVKDWEIATSAASTAGIRVVYMRFGMVLGKGGGALGKMLPAFRLGLGGRVGDGKQYMSWMSLADLVEACKFCIAQETLVGPINFVAPQPAINAEFTRTLGQVLHRPTVITLPAFAAKLLLGREMAQELLLVSSRVCPERLEQSGFSFKHPTLREALEYAVG